MNILGRDKINKEIKIETDHFSTYQVVGNKTCEYTKWGMEVQKENASDMGWVEDNQIYESPPQPYTPPSRQFAFNYKWDNLSVLDIWTMPQTEQRIKLKRGEGTVFGNGIYEWKVFVPVDEGNDDATSIGAFIYHDDDHEFDFEITYGKLSERLKYGAIYSWQKLCYMQSQKKMDLIIKEK